MPDKRQAIIWTNDGLFYWCICGFLGISINLEFYENLNCVFLLKILYTKWYPWENKIIWLSISILNAPMFCISWWMFFCIIPLGRNACGQAHILSYQQDAGWFVCDTPKKSLFREEDSIEYILITSLQFISFLVCVICNVRKQMRYCY